MITLEDDSLNFRFPNVHKHAHCSIQFQRTLRIPDDGKVHYLPPGLGAFPLRHLDDYSQRLPPGYAERGGVLMPMYQAEALWICFDSPSSYPCAVKIATGKICAITGDNWVNHLNQDPQDYVVLPDQPWLDGYCVGDSVIRQFLAMPLGENLTVEKQVTGEESIGGIQITVFPMKSELYEQMRIHWQQDLSEPHDCMVYSKMETMGLAAGGKMRQSIDKDPHGLDAWDLRNGRKCFVTIANSKQWLEITGEPSPTQPITVEDYNKHGLPWFDFYSENASISATEKLVKIKGINELAGEQGKAPIATGSNKPKKVISHGRGARRPVREFES